VVADAVAMNVASILTAMMSEQSQPGPWRLVGVDAVADVLGRSRRWVHRAVKERGLLFIRLDGGALAFDLDDVREWARERRVPAVETDALAPRLQGSPNGAASATSWERALTSGPSSSLTRSCCGSLRRTERGCGSQ